MKKKMVNFDQYRITDNLTALQSRANIRFPLFLMSLTNSRTLASSPNSMFNGDTTMYGSNLEMNGRWCSK